MASHKKQSEGIALLSIYGDDEDDEEMEDIEEQQPEPQHQQQLSLLEEEQQLPQTLTPAQDDAVSAPDYYYNNYNNTNINDEDDVNRVADDITPPMLAVEQLQQQQVETDDFSPKASNYVPSPQQQQMMVSGLESNRSRKAARLAIVDYGHDEMAMSPEPEEGEILATGRVMYGEELQTANGNFQERTPSGTIQGPSPGTQATPPQSSEQNDLPQSDVANYTSNGSKPAEAVEVVMVTSEETQDVNPLAKFLPPPPKAKCSEEPQEKIRKFLKLKRKDGRSYNAEVRNRKDYRNPDFLLHAVTYQDIDQIGSCFSKDVFDPHGYDKSDFYDEIEADMRREMERKEQERKRSPKVEFIAGGTQPGSVFPTPKINMPIPGLNSVPAGDGRQNKKSKWDKVDGDQKNPVSTGGKDNMSAVAANAALLSAANAGTGYTAFAQQRRREAEEKRSSSDKKLERRS